MANPWEIFWNAQAYKGKTALLDRRSREIARDGAAAPAASYDINTEDPAKINKAARRPEGAATDLQHQGQHHQYQTIPEDKAGCTRPGRAT